MGRWAQARRTGGGQGGTGEQALARMATATIKNANEIRVTYTGNVDADQMDNPEFFMTGPASFLSDTASQVSPNVIDVFFTDGIGAQTSISWEGTAPGVLEPDSIAIT